VTSSQPIRLRERLSAAWTLVLLSALLLLCIPIGQGGRSDTDARRLAPIATTSDRADPIASAGRGHSPPTSTPVLAQHRDHAWILCSPCDGEDGASDRGPSSMTTGWSPHWTVSLLESTRSAVRWRPRGRGPPHHA